MTTAGKECLFARGDFRGICEPDHVTVRRSWESTFGDEPVVIACNPGTMRASAIEGFRKRDGKLIQVLEETYSGNSVMLADEIFSVGKFYTDALVAVESNGIGDVTNQRLRDLGYEKIFTWRHYSGRARMGFQTTTRMRDLMITNFRELLSTSRVVLRSKQLLEQIFDYTDGQANGEDDLLMAAMIAVWVAEDNGR